MAPMPTQPKVTAGLGSLVAAALLLGCARKPQEPPLALPAGALTPQQSMAKMELAPGFQVSLVASEPEVRQPVALNWDERGRLWVVEYIQYPDPAGLKALE